MKKNYKTRRINEMKTVLTIEEAAAYLGISKGTLYNLTSAKRIKHYKPQGGRVFFAETDLQTWALKNPVEVVKDSNNSTKN